MKATKQLDVLARLNTITTKAYLDESRNEEAILQHHDAVTGTSPQETADDYTSRLFSSWDANVNVLQRAYKAILQIPIANATDKKASIHVFCDTLNMTECRITENSDRFVVTIYNPIGRSVSQWIRFPVDFANYSVTDVDGKRVNSELIPISPSLLRIPERRSRAMQELTFRVHLPALGFSTYYVNKTSGIKSKF